MRPEAEIKSSYPKRVRRSFHLNSPKFRVPYYIANTEKLANNGNRGKRESFHIRSVIQYRKYVVNTSKNWKQE
jgi:hypothetical protein